MTKHKTKPADAIQAQPEPTATKGPRPSTKFAAIMTKLQAPDGVTVAEIQALTGWQEHSVRGALAGTFKKRFGLTIVSEKVVERGRVYRVAAPVAEAAS
jgi:hypothetical protein